MNTQARHHATYNYPRLVDISLLFAVSLIISLLCYHRYYFGDELTAFFRSGANASFMDIYRDLNKYKPRLIFNALWAAYGSFSAPRVVPMLINAVCMGSAASALYTIAIKHFDAGRVASVLIAVALVTSRFGAMLYFDYVAGNIETLSLLLFLFALYYSIKAIEADTPRRTDLALTVLFCCLMVMVHERYIVASLVIGGFIILAGLRKNRVVSASTVGGAIAAIIPLVLFYASGKLFASLPIETGTSGRIVSINLDTIHDFGMYLSNVMLGTNFGHPWFVGTLSLGMQPGEYLIPIVAAVLAVLWAILLAQGRERLRFVSKPALLIVLTLALIAVASLPGPTKQESRWMFPVGATVGLFAISIGRRRSFQLTLGAFLVVNLIYYATGSYKAIFNVQASTAARYFGEAFSNLPKQAGPGIILNASIPETTWWLGGDTILGNDASSGRVFCRINFSINSACMYPPNAIGSSVRHYSFGLRFGAGTGGRPPSYTYVNGKALGLYERIGAAARGQSRGIEGVKLTITPPTISTCSNPTPKASVVVSWATTTRKVRAVSVWADTQGGSPVLFAEGGANGSAQTGQWVTPGLSFVLVDKASGEVLASTTAIGLGCPSH